MKLAKQYLRQKKDKYHREALPFPFMYFNSTNQRSTSSSSLLSSSCFTSILVATYTTLTTKVSLTSSDTTTFYEGVIYFPNRCTKTALTTYINTHNEF